MNSFVFLKPNFRACYEHAILSASSSARICAFPSPHISQAASFKEFDLHVQNAAHHINEVAQSKKLVVTAAGNSLEHMVYIVAALLTGRSVCLINPQEGLNRVRQKVTSLNEECAIFVDREAETWKDEIGACDMNLDSAAPVRKASWVDFPSDRPFILIFTSGSTGYSKIVEQAELGVLTNVDALIERHRLHEGGCIGTPLPISHVNALEFSFFSCLFTGRTLVLWGQVVFPQFAETLAKEKCTILSIVPPILRSLLNRESDFQKHDLSHLKYFVSAAAPLSGELVVRALEIFKRPIVQGYGLSEAVNFSCLMPTDLDEVSYRKIMLEEPWTSIGTPLRGSEVEILGEHGQILGENDRGQIGIRGPTLMRGYRGDSERKWYQHGYLNTGDLGYFKAGASGERYFYICGRQKEIAKRNGITISLREVDDIMARFNSEMDAISVAFANDVTGEEVAIVVHQSSAGSETETRLCQHIETSLPPHIRPRVVFFTKRKLRTASGKPQRHKFYSLFDSFRKLAISGPIRFFVDPNVDE